MCATRISTWSRFRNRCEAHHRDAESFCTQGADRADREEARARSSGAEPVADEHRGQSAGQGARARAGRRPRGARLQRDRRVSRDARRAAGADSGGAGAACGAQADRGDRRRDLRRRGAAWIARQAAKIPAALLELERLLGKKEHFTSHGVGLAEIATGCALGYLDLRYPQLDWRGANPALAALATRLAKRASFAATLPKAQEIPAQQ